MESEDDDGIDTKLAYKDMNQRYYYIATGSSIILITFIASSIK